MMLAPSKLHRRFEPVHSHPLRPKSNAVTSESAMNAAKALECKESTWFTRVDSCTVTPTLEAQLNINADEVFSFVVLVVPWIFWER